MTLKDTAPETITASSFHRLKMPHGKKGGCAGHHAVKVTISSCQQTVKAVDTSNFENHDLVQAAR
jgi:hypothetical protein